MIRNRNPAHAGASVAALALILGALLPATPASSQIGLEEFVTLGRCESLIAGGRDRTLMCKERLTSGHAGGRSAFAFSLGATNKISFAGFDGPALGDRATIAIDMVLVWRDREMPSPGPEVIPASGTCTYVGPNLGISTITCDASTAQGRFSAIFHTDGRAPDLQPAR